MKNEGSRKLKFYLIYRKIPKISPRDYIFQRPFLRDKLKGRGRHTSTHGRAGTSRMQTTISPGQWQPWTAFSPLYIYEGKCAFQNRPGLYLEGNLSLKNDWASLLYLEGNLCR